MSVIEFKLPVVYSLEEVATALRAAVKTLERASRTGTVPHMRMGKCYRFRENHIREFLRRNLVSASAGGEDLPSEGLPTLHDGGEAAKLLRIGEFSLLRARKERAIGHFAIFGRILFSEQQIRSYLTRDVESDPNPDETSAESSPPAPQPETRGADPINRAQPDRAASLAKLVGIVTDLTLAKRGSGGRPTKASRRAAHVD